MEKTTEFKTKPRSSQLLCKLVACFFISAMMLTGIPGLVHAQEVQYERPTWRFGIVGAGNGSYYMGTTQQLSANEMAHQPFGHGKGVGLFLTPTIEYHRPESLFGFMLTAGLDSRRGAFDQVLSPCDCPLDLSTELSYLSVEPSIRVAPFKSNFYLFGGPRLAFTLNKSFEYDRGVNPDFPNSSEPENIQGDFSDMEKTQISMQIGTGWDIPLNSKSNKTQYMISPFVSYHPYMGQTPRSIETWNVSTLRTGVAIKFGRGKRVESRAPRTVVADARMPAVHFTVNSPVNAPVDVRFIESFPLRNYIFFDRGSASIPDRYIKLNRNQAANFSEVQLGQFNQITAVGRSQRQMTVYYNILNILGERMQKNPSSTINLVGFSEQSDQTARRKAESIKSYLVTTFGITPSRITTEGRIVRATQAGGIDRELLRQEYSRVAIESRSLAILKEFQTGPNAPLRSITRAEDAPIDSYVTFHAEGASRAFNSWKLEVRDENNRMQTFGPYTDDHASLSGRSILGDRSRGNYRFTMIGEDRNGRMVTKQAQSEVVRWVIPVVERGSRYSVIYEFDQSNTLPAYEAYLLNVVTPAIPSGGTVRIQGYSDTIGNAAYNQQLSEARAANVRAIIRKGLAAAGRSDVKFDVKGHGAVLSESQFRNTLPEERFYNRTVLIDIIPVR